MSNQHTCLAIIPRNMTAVFRIFSWRIILNRFYFDGRHFTSTMQCLKACWALPKLCTMRSVSSHEGTCNCNTSLGHVPATFSCVCKYYDFAPATCPRYTSLLHVASVCTTHVFFAATCRCNMTLQHDPSCLATLRIYIRSYHELPTERQCSRDYKGLQTTNDQLTTDEWSISFVLKIAYHFNKMSVVNLHLFQVRRFSYALRFKHNLTVKSLPQ